VLTDDDKKWIAAEISASEERVGALAGYEERVGARLDRFEAALIAEFQKWTLPLTSDPGIEAAALRTLDLEIESLQGRVDKLEGK
jgi:hypothetical protein